MIESLFLWDGSYDIYFFQLLSVCDSCSASLLYCSGEIALVYSAGGKYNVLSGGLQAVLVDFMRNGNCQLYSGIIVEQMPWDGEKTVVCGRSHIGYPTMAFFQER